MSVAKTRTRSQYVSIEVEKADGTVSIYGPSDVVEDVKFGIGGNRVKREVTVLGNGTMMKVSGQPYKLMKASVLEEVLQLGFTLTSSLDDDCLRLSREVKL